MVAGAEGHIVLIPAGGGVTHAVKIVSLPYAEGPVPVDAVIAPGRGVALHPLHTPDYRLLAGHIHAGVLPGCVAAVEVRFYLQLFPLRANLERRGELHRIGVAAVDR